MNSQVIVRFDGRVQGVGFRYTVVQIAREFSVSGYVANVSDGSVQVVAEGERTELEEFLQAIQSSRLGEFGQSEIKRWSEPTGRYAHFTIQFAVDYPQ